MANLYIVQRPQSNSNRTNKYRVILHEDWLNWLDAGNTKAVIEAVSEHDAYKDAEVVRDRLNEQVRRGE